MAKWQNGKMARRQNGRRENQPFSPLALFLLCKTKVINGDQLMFRDWIKSFPSQYEDWFTS
jgi:hypothetical protein